MRRCGVVLAMVARISSFGPFIVSAHLHVLNRVSYRSPGGRAVVRHAPGKTVPPTLAHSQDLRQLYPSRAMPQLTSPV